MLVLLGAGALAAAPQPDQPYLARNVWAVAPQTVELEGAGVAGFDPTSLAEGRVMLKYSVPARIDGELSAIYEPRVAVTRIANATFVEAGLKAQLSVQDDKALVWGAFVGVRFSTSQGSEAGLEFRPLVNYRIADRLSIRGEAGLDLDVGPAEGRRLSLAVPVIAAVTFVPILNRDTSRGTLVQRLGVFGEGFVRLNDNQRALGAGAWVRVTSLLVAGASVRWFGEGNGPQLNVSLVTNMGRVR